ELPGRNRGRGLPLGAQREFLLLHARYAVARRPVLRRLAHGDVRLDVDLGTRDAGPLEAGVWRRVEPSPRYPRHGFDAGADERLAGATGDFTAPLVNACPRR